MRIQHAIHAVKLIVKLVRKFYVTYSQPSVIKEKTMTITEQDLFFAFKKNKDIFLKKIHLYLN